MMKNCRSLPSPSCPSFRASWLRPLQQPCTSPATRTTRRISMRPLAAAPKTKDQIREGQSTSKESQPDIASKLKDMVGLGDTLGPIGMTIGGDTKSSSSSKDQDKRDSSGVGGLALGPISLSFGSEFGEAQEDRNRSQESSCGPEGAPPSISSMTTAEWRSAYEKDGAVDLWMEDEFNAGSRLVGGRDVHKGGSYGTRTGEGVSVSTAVKHKVKIFNHYANQVVDVEVPEDRYILWEAEDEGLELPYACRMGCCTACAVRIKEGEMYQPEALGISAELREQGYGLMCVGYPLTDMVLETVPENEVYELQFGDTFAQKALNPQDTASVERDDFALEIATYDE